MLWLLKLKLDLFKFKYIYKFIEYENPALFLCINSKADIRL